MVDYQISFFVTLGFAIVELLVILIVSIRIRRSKKVFALLKEVRKQMRIHHKAEADLFKGIDKVIVNLALKNLELPKKRETEEGWNEYG
jgi:hypothetical protein